MKVLRVFEYGPNAWNFVPASLKTAREPHARGCKCLGTGNLGTVSREEGGIKVSHTLPCPCLVAIIDAENEAAVEDELNQHYMELKTEGGLCGCLFCQLRRKVLADQAVTV